MSDVELKKFKTNNPTAHTQVVDILNGKRGICFIAKENNYVVGYLLAEKKADQASSIRYAELRDMKVHEDYRRKGIGSQLVERFVQWAKDKEYERLSVDVYALNEKNIGFYQKLGFTPMTLAMERWFE